MLYWTGSEEIIVCRYHSATKAYYCNMFVNCESWQACMSKKLLWRPLCHDCVWWMITVW